MNSGQENGLLLRRTLESQCGPQTTSGNDGCLRFLMMTGHFFRAHTLSMCNTSLQSLDVALGQSPPATSRHWLRRQMAGLAMLAGRPSRSPVANASTPHHISTIGLGRLCRRPRKPNTISTLIAPHRVVFAAIEREELNKETASKHISTNQC